MRRGARELVERLGSLDIPYHILTNTSGSSVPEISARLVAMGLEIPEARITNASEVTVNYIRERSEARTVLTLGGGSGLAHALQVQGFKQVAVERLEDEQFTELLEAAPRTAYPLVLGWTRDYGFELATKLLRLEKVVTEVYAASADRYFAGESGNLPAVAWLSGSVGALLGKVPINPAKPNAYALAYVLRKLHSAAVQNGGHRRQHLGHSVRERGRLHDDLIARRSYRRRRAGEPEGRRGSVSRHPRTDRPVVRAASYSVREVKIPPAAALMLFG